MKVFIVVTRIFYYIYSFDVDLRYINTVDGDFPALLVEEKTGDPQTRDTN
jgi:hypothetical protein